MSDSHGLIAEIAVDSTPSRFPWVWLPSPGFGFLNGSYVYYIGSLWTRPGRTNMQITEWPERYDRLQKNTPVTSFGGKPFEMSVPSPKILKTR
jgi:hypothetical protein